jgi:hypothetical protein
MMHLNRAEESSDETSASGVASSNFVSVPSRRAAQQPVKTHDPVRFEDMGEMVTDICLLMSLI